MPGRRHFMTLKDLKDRIYNIINVGDGLMTAQDKADCILIGVLKWKEGE